MTPKMLGSYARLLELKALAWEVAAEAACVAATEAFSRARTAHGAAEIVAARAEGHTLLPTHQQPQSLTPQGKNRYDGVSPAPLQRPGDVPGNPQGGSRDDRS